MSPHSFPVFKTGFIASAGFLFFFFPAAAVVTAKQTVTLLCHFGWMVHIDQTTTVQTFKYTFLTAFIHNAIHVFLLASRAESSGIPEPPADYYV
jgi:hypothetical protein